MNKGNEIVLSDNDKWNQNWWSSWIMQQLDNWKLLDLSADNCDNTSKAPPEWRSTQSNEANNNGVLPTMHS